MVALLCRHVWLILLVTIVVGGAAAYVAYTTSPSYQATAAIRLSDARRELTTGLDDPASAMVSQSVDPVQSEIQVLTSRAVAGTVVDTVSRLRLSTTGFPLDLVNDVAILPAAGPDSLATATVALTFGSDGVTASGSDGRSMSVAYRVPIVVGGLRFSIAEHPANAETGEIELLPRDAAITNLLASLKVQARENTNVIDVTYTGSNPYTAQQVVNAVVQRFQIVSRETAQQQSRLRREFVEQQLHENDSLLASARLALSAFRGQEQAYSAKDKFTAEQSGIAELEVRREQLEADRRLYGSILADLDDPQSPNSAVELRARLSAPGTNPNPVVVELLSQITTYEARRDSLVAGGTGRALASPEVTRVDTLLASTRARTRETVRSVIAALDSRIRDLDRFEARNSTLLTQLSGTETKEARLAEQVATYSKMGDQLRDEFQKARLAEAVELGRVEVLDFAALPSATTSVSKPKKVAFGVLLGVLVGCAVALLIEYLNTSIRHRKELEAALRLPGLAVIPKFERRRVWRRLPAPLFGRRGRNGTHHGPRVGDTVVAAAALHSEAAEAYRQLRTKLLFSCAVEPMKTIMVTSALPQDGKTTIAANLATTFAQQHLRVLLIDCDLRRPGQHRLFGLCREPGLSQLLGSDGITDDMIQATSVDGLFVIAAGATLDDPSQLLGGVRMRTILDAFADQFDVIVLDSPPILSVTDATILASMTDGVLLAVRAGQTDRSAAQLALEQLVSVGARVIGAVLNDPDHKVLKYEEYYHRAYRAYQRA